MTPTPPPGTARPTRDTPGRIVRHTIPGGTRVLVDENYPGLGWPDTTPDRDLEVLAADPTRGVYLRRLAVEVLDARWRLRHGQPVPTLDRSTP